MKNLYIKQIDVVADEKNNAVPSIIFSEFVNELSDLNEEFFNFIEDFKKVWIPKLQAKIINYLLTLEETSYSNIESHLKQYLENINESFLNLFLDKQFKTISKKVDKDVYFSAPIRHNNKEWFSRLLTNFSLYHLKNTAYNFLAKS